MALECAGRHEFFKTSHSIGFMLFVYLVGETSAGRHKLPFTNRLVLQHDVTVVSCAFVASYITP